MHLRKMKKIDKILLLIIPILIISCSSSFIKSTKTKTVKLKSIKSQKRIVGFENDFVIIKINKNDLINLFEKDNSEFYDYRISKQIDKLEKMQTDLIFQKSKQNGEIELAEYEIKLYELLKKGKVRIYDKSTNKDLKKIKYIFTRDKLGGKRLEIESMDKRKLYDMILAYGE